MIAGWKRASTRALSLGCRGLAAPVSALCLAAAAASGEEPSPQEAQVLPEVVVTATRTAEDPARLPYVTHAVGGEEIRTRRAARSLPQALAELPAVSIQQTSFGQESPFIRGFTGFRTLLLVDGIRVNNATFREGPNQYWGLVDPLAAERVEVVKGPSSVLYGSDAIGGTVNALTPEEFEAGVHPGAYYRFASAERSHTARADVRGEALGSVGYAGGVVWRDLGDLSGGRRIGEQEQTGYEALSGDGKGFWKVSERVNLTAAFQSMDQFDVPRTHSTIHAVSFHGTAVGTDLRRDLDQVRRFGYLRSEWRPEADWLDSVTLTFSYQLQMEEEDRVRGSGRKQLQGFEDHTAGVLASATSPTRIGRWTYGFEWYGDWVEDSFRKDFRADGTLERVLPRGPVADDARYDLLGVYVQDECHPWERVTLIAGARYNFAHASADGEDIDPDDTDAQTFADLSESYHAAVGSGRILYQLTPHISPFAGVSQGFRAPNLSDLTRFDAARSNEQEVPATDLDPEYYIAYEGGLRGRWDRWGASAAYFYTDIDDMIIRVPTGQVTATGERVVTKDNVGDGFLHGVEVQGDWNFYEGFTTFGGFSWTDGKVETFLAGGEKELKPLSRVPPAQWLVGLRYDSEKRDWWVESTGRFVLKQDRLAPEDKEDVQRIPPGGTPGYYLLGLRGGVRIRQRLHLFAGVENITDQDYRVHGSGVNGPGTSFVGGLELRL